MIYLSPNPQRLAGRIVVVCTYAIEGRDKFPEDMSYEDGFDSIRQSINKLRGQLSSVVADGLASMNEQAKAHFDAGDVKLGASLMQDMEQVVQGKPSFAYPRDMYRWQV